MVRRDRRAPALLSAAVWAFTGNQAMNILEMARGTKALQRCKGASRPSHSN